MSAAVRGAVGFLTRLPVAHREGEFEAFAGSPWAFPLVGYLVGAVAAVALLARPPAVATAGYLLAVFLLTGVNHADGLADLGDAAAVHAGEDPASVREARVAAMKDTDLGVGGALAVAVAVVALALGALALARQAASGVAPHQVLAVAVGAEVGAKLGLAALACLGDARHEGLGSALTEPNGGRDLLAPALVALPAVVLSVPSPAAAAALAGAVVGALVVWAWARAALGGVSGDVFGAANELGRLVGLHLGAVALLA